MYFAARWKLVILLHQGHHVNTYIFLLIFNVIALVLNIFLFASSDSSLFRLLFIGLSSAAVFICVHAIRQIHDSR